MKYYSDILMQSLREQLALEEHLNRVIKEQVLAISDSSDFTDAKQLLEATGRILEDHFHPLNGMLTEIEKSSKNEGHNCNGDYSLYDSIPDAKQALISRILRDDYTALNKITTNNALLHTIALAGDAKDIAATALKHLEALAPVVIQIADLLPEVVTRELLAIHPGLDPAVASQALRNMRNAWRRT